MRPRCLPTLAAIVVLLAPPSLAAGPDRAVEVESIRVGFDDACKIGAWTPVRVEARAGAGPFEGTMEVVAEDESGAPTAFAVPARLGAGQSATIVAYARLGSPASGLGVRFLVDGRAVAEVDATGSGAPPRRFFSDEVVVLALGRPQGLELVPGLAGYSGDRGGASGSVEVVRVPAIGRDALPDRPLGYDAFDAVVVDTNDRELMAALAAGGEPLRRWVAQGGHLVVAVGANWQAVKGSPLAALLPASPSGTIAINDVRTIESFAGATTQLGAGPQGLTIPRLEEDRDRPSKALCATSTTPIVVRGAYGFGRVTVLALDVDAEPFASWADRPLFWVHALDLHPIGSAMGLGNRGRFTQTTVNDLSGRLREALEQFPGVRLVPFGWVAFFIFVYLLLIGPGDYLFLRRVLKRMELTWITFPTIVVVVSALAYWAAVRSRGTELRVNQVEVVDVDVPAKLVRGAAFVDVYSPANRDYDVAIVPKPVDGRGAMPAGTEAVVSWFASPGTGPRGMGGGGRSLGFGAEPYRYVPDGRAESLRGVRIPIWSTKAFSARWFAPFEGPEPVIESDLTPMGIDRLNGTVTNRLGVELKRAVLAFNKRVYYNLGDLAPGESKQVELTQDRNIAGFLKDLVPDYDRRSPSATIDRYALMQAILFRESDASGATPLPSRPLHRLDLTGQLLLDRPILMAEVERPMSALDLGGASPGRAEQRTTVIRVILPLKR